MPGSRADSPQKQTGVKLLSDHNRNDSNNSSTSELAAMRATEAIYRKHPTLRVLAWDQRSDWGGQELWQEGRETSALS